MKQNAFAGSRLWELKLQGAGKLRGLIMFERLPLCSQVPKLGESKESLEGSWGSVCLSYGSGIKLCGFRTRPLGFNGLATAMLGRGCARASIHATN